MFLRALLTVSLLGLLCSPVVGQTSCAALYGQCGGSGYTGVSCCQSGSECVSVNAYYYQCTPASSSVTSASSTTSASSQTSASTTSSTSSTTSSTSSTTSATGTTSSSSAVSTYTGPQDYTTTTSVATTGTVTQAAYPSANASSCGDWALVDNVCCPYYCLSNNESSSCDSTCTGACGSPDSSMCKSGTMWGEQHTVGYDETWHYSRSTHFGLTSGGACGFGLYGLCTQNVESWVDDALGDTCTAFCTAYPLLCTDPTNVTMRGNFAAPNGDYYTQFWSSLASQGALDNYLSCGECFELIMTYPNGSDYAVGDAGYTPPIYLEIVDSCPCDANPKWCCGPGADHCGEIDFEYGCPLPEGSHHMDLSDIAMGRLQGNGSLSEGVIPIRYQRVPCPSPGNVYIWLRDGGGPYYFALTAVNTNGVGSLEKIEIIGADQTEWTTLVTDPNYTESRPQERYGAYTIPQNTGPYNLPIGIRLTSPNGEVIVNEQAITSWTAPATAPSGYWYIDLGVQFSTT